MSEFDFLLGESETLPAPTTDAPGLEAEFDSAPVAASDKHSVEYFTDPKNLSKFIAKTKKIPLEAVDDFMVNQAYPAAVWQFRSRALQGDYTGTRALEIWLRWAGEIIRRPKREKQKGVNNSASAEFMPREPKKQEEE